MIPLTEKDLLEQYLHCFNTFDIQGMIKAKKEWARKYKRKERFHIRLARILNMNS